VTEGVADCLVALQADVLTISPATVRFSKACYPRLLQLARHAQRMIICNDNEDSQAGMKGAMATAAFLDREGVDVRLVTLPRPAGVSKIDLADFLKSHITEDFQRLCDAAPAYLDARLATYPVSDDGYTNCQTARQFVTEVLGQCPEKQRALAFLRHRVKAYFKLRNSDIDDLISVFQPAHPHTPSPSRQSPPPPSSGQAPAWRKDLITTKAGEPKECAGNFVLYLEHHPHLTGQLWWDAVRHRPMRDKEPLTDALIAELGAWLGKAERFPVRSLRLLERCVHAVAYRTQRDLLREWLTSLPPWDGIPTLDTWLPLVTGATATPYTRWLGRTLITSMVARALDPGCIQRYVIILEGPESTSKSALVQALAPDSYTTLSMALESKEAHIQIQGAWVVELTELDSLSRTEESRIKAFITMRADDYVPKFANSPVSYKRRAIFVGTTNEKQYLRGQTGNTRFFPVATATIDLDLFQTLREGLFAEALAYYQDHPKDWWEIPPNVTSELEVAREQRRIDTPFEEIIGNWLAGQAGTEFTWVEIARGALGITDLEHLKDKSLQMQVAAAMRQQGYTRTDSKHGGSKTMKVWTK
jgi:predicted P-loop ATPase